MSANSRLRILPNILLVEDDEAYGKALRRLLSDECDHIDQVGSCEEAVKAIAGRETYYDVIVLDHGLKGQSTGLECLRLFKKLDVLAEVIVLTGLGSRELGVEALREGAFRYFTKQSENDEELICAIMVAHDMTRAKRSNAYWKETGKKLNISLVTICIIAVIAISAVVILNIVAPKNFFLSAVAVCALLLVLFFGASGVRRFRMIWKEGGKSGELDAEGTAGIDHRKRI